MTTGTKERQKKEREDLLLLQVLKQSTGDGAQGLVTIAMLHPSPFALGEWWILDP